jgi:hypothetical protein
LPILIKIIAGAGAVSTLVSIFPWLVPVTKHKDWIFIILGILLVANGLFIYISSFKKECPVDKREACQTVKGWTKVIYWVVVALYLIGAFTAYLLTPLALAMCRYLGFEHP